MEEIRSYNNLQYLTSSLIKLIILVAVIALIVLAIRKLSKRSKRMDGTTTSIIIALVIVAGIWFALGILGVNGFYLVPRLIEWATMFILPWVALYWLVRLIKALEKK
ncbi:hypothetical protein PGH26_08650 [Sporosarcina jeotgali]|uniref:Uncharacterized protein n=1 Tax=Sporosarcina jeotgali TaxID=3020056 RepID=A0ABZ0KSL7_9BACL|nr:hypothetical protein [Sporosarcina sp. B2O-1]WOV83011.1 hypothetical protein PGH26_08650 [Sporosarcina sp. B2O-1]